MRDDLLDRSMKTMARTTAFREGFASVMHEALRKQIEKFQDELSPTEEVAALLTNFGSSVSIVISHLTYQNPHLIIIRGWNMDGRDVELLQHVSQVSILLERVSAPEERKARRVGFEPPEGRDNRHE